MKVNEIFYSLQGEGNFTGTPAVFVRFSGCNLACNFCDTKHQTFEELTEEEIVKQVSTFPTVHVVLTGGEPTMQITASLLDALHRAGKFIQLETNGTLSLSEELLTKIDWITCSPKFGMKPSIQRIDELKVVFDYQHTEDIEKVNDVETTYLNTYYLQPCDKEDAAYNSINTRACIEYIIMNPKWKLSLQTHKMLNLR